MVKKKVLASFIVVLAVILGLSTISFTEEGKSGGISFEDLKAAFPGADQFSYKKEISKRVPHVFYAFYIDMDSGEDILLGYVLETHDWAPEVAGFRGPIMMLVGLDLEGKIVGLTIVSHQEDAPSMHQIDDGWLLKQFIGKGADNALQIGEDIDAVSQATMTSQAIAKILKTTLARFSDLEAAAAGGIPPVEAVAAQEMKDEEFVKKERELDQMLQEKKLSLTPAKYYRVI